MTSYDHDLLSGFLDGELSAEQTKDVEAALAADPELQAALEQLISADTHAKDNFEQIAAQPVPLSLASAIEKAPTSSPTQHHDAVANDEWAGGKISTWLRAAAIVMTLMVGGVGGYFVGSTMQIDRQVADVPEWLLDVADYHRVYAAEGRHLVEVEAQERAHIQSWLSARVGTEFEVPDLSSFGLNFEGARLLVAAGKPVAQLMFADADGRVVALCFLSSDKPDQGVVQRTLGDLDMLSWTGEGASYVVVGDAERDDLASIAENVAQVI